MADGPGKYDDICTQARVSAQADGAIVIIVGGKKGNGFSAQLSQESLARVPSVLRSVADQIEQSENMPTVN